MSTPRILIIGYGNPGRLDDGLGPAFAAEIERLAPPGVRVESSYQLCVEDAAAVARHDVVIFADAATDSMAAFYFRRLEPVEDHGFSTHNISPAAVLGLAHELFAAQTVGFLLGIRGSTFNGLGEHLSPAAEQNLTAAVAYLEIALFSGDIAAHVTGRADCVNPSISPTCEV